MCKDEKRWLFDVLLFFVTLLCATTIKGQSACDVLGALFLTALIRMVWTVMVKLLCDGKSTNKSIILIVVMMLLVSALISSLDGNLKYGVVYGLVGGYIGGRLITHLMP